MTDYRSSKMTTQARSAVMAAPSADNNFESLRTLLLSVRSRIGPSQLIPLGAALLFAIGCTLWAIQEGVSVPLALMGGYCTIVAGIILCVAQLMLTHVNTSPAPAHAPRKPNYAAWKLVNKLNVSNASRLWCEIEPGHPYTQESAAWTAALLDAIKSGALPISPKAHATKEMIAQERANPGWNTEVSRDALKTWAKAHGHCPTFLRD